MSQALPDYITDYPHLLTRIRETGVFDGSKHGQPNHVLLNEYLPGQGIMPHEDGPAYFPSVATLSLGSHTVMHYYQYTPSAAEKDNGSSKDVPESKSASAGRGPIDKEPVLTLFLEPRSLVITRSQLYTHHLHGIDGITRDVIHPSGSQCEVDSISSDRIANRHLVHSESLRTILDRGGELERTKRISLTFRDVEKVFNPRFR